MTRKIHIVAAFVLIFIFSPLSAEERSLGTAFTDKLLSTELRVSDKLSLLSKEYYPIEKEDAARLVEYLKICDKDLFIPISKLIFQHEEHIAYVGKVYNLMLTRRKELVSKPEDVLPFMTYLSNLLILHRSTSTKEKHDFAHPSDKLLEDCEKLTDELLDIINQMPPEKQEETINILFSGDLDNGCDLDNGFVELLKMTNGEKFIRNSMKGIESGNEHEIKSSLLILSKIDPSTHFSDESFLSKIASLTRHNNSGISHLSNEILERCTGIKGGKDFNWSDWLRKNPPNTRGDIALDRLKDSNLSVDDRIKALDLVFVANYGKWNATSDSFKTIISIFQDDNTPFPLRRELLGALVCIASLDTASTHGKQSQLNESVLKSITMMFNVALKNNDEQWLVRMIRAVSSSKIRLLDKDLKIRNELCRIISDDSYKRQVQLAAVVGLSQVKIRRKEVAQKLLSFYERWSKMHHYDESNEELTQELVQILLVMQEITGKPAQNNKTLELVRSIDYWRKAVSAMPDDPPEEKREEK